MSPYDLPRLHASPATVKDPEFRALRVFLHDNAIGCRVWDNETRCPGAMSVLHNDAAIRLLEYFRADVR